MSRTVTSAGKPASPERWQAAAHRAREKKIEVRHLGTSGVWVADSASRPDLAHALVIRDGIVESCDCEAARFGDPCCVHAAAFYLHVGALVLPDETADEGEVAT